MLSLCQMAPSFGVPKNILILLKCWVFPLNVCAPSKSTKDPSVVWFFFNASFFPHQSSIRLATLSHSHSKKEVSYRIAWLGWEESLTIVSGPGLWFREHWSTFLGLRFSLAKGGFRSHRDSVFLVLSFHGVREAAFGIVGMIYKPFQVNQKRIM